jgi:hypothetical protein
MTAIHMSGHLPKFERRGELYLQMIDIYFLQISMTILKG